MKAVRFTVSEVKSSEKGSACAMPICPASKQTREMDASTLRMVFFATTNSSFMTDKIYIIGRRNLVVKKEKTKRNFFRFA